MTKKRTREDEQAAAAIASRPAALPNLKQLNSVIASSKGQGGGRERAGLGRGGRGEIDWPSTFTRLPRDQWNRTFTLPPPCHFMYDLYLRVMKILNSDPLREMHEREMRDRNRKLARLQEKEVREKLQREDADKASFLVKVRRLLVITASATSTAITPSYLQGRVARDEPLPVMTLVSPTGGQQDEEEGRQLRTMLAFVVGMEGGFEGQGMPRDMFRVMLDFLMPMWDPLCMTFGSMSRKIRSKKKRVKK